MPPHDLLDSFLENLEAPLAETTPWIVAFSGGPDSTALLDLLVRAGATALVAFHLNHGLRGEEADLEEEFARQQAERLGVKFQVQRLKPEPGRQTAIEAWARDQRYAALSRAARDLGATRVFFGHHQNDQAETVIQRLMRGAGFRGLAGIPATRPLVRGSSVRLHRPLLFCSRARIEAYLSFRPLNYSLDPSNKKDLFQRNRIRHRLLPALNQALPGDTLLEELLGLATSARAIQQTLEKGAAAYFSRLKQPKTACFAPFARADSHACHSLALSQVREVPPLFLHALLERALNLRLSREAFAQACALILATGGPGTLCLGPGLYLERKAELLEARREAPAEEFPERRLLVPGEVELPSGALIRARFLAKNQVALHAKDPMREVIDGDRAGEQLLIRQRRDGDRFCPLGRAEPKKLKRFLIDEKVPADLRQHLALVCNDQEILWVAGLRLSHSCRISPASRRFLLLEARS